MQVVVPEEFKSLYVHDEQNPIIKYPAEVLRTVAVPIKRYTRRYQTVGDNMVRVMNDARGYGLAAPQIGISERIIVLASDGKPTIMFNPVVVGSEGTQLGEEGCLSIPGLFGMVERAEKVEVEALDRKGRESTFRFEGLDARVVLHEIDHLDGVLFIDKADPTTFRWEMPKTAESDPE
ncbi:MAG: peptide deformylase [Armatimonadetes bacterium]|nr:peptide deformylase [Armatimonadota bacterium]